MALAALVLAAAGGAAGLAVLQSTTETLHGELLTVGTEFRVLPKGIAVQATGLPAAGTASETAVELGLVPLTASPGVTIGNYAYLVQLDESAISAVASGTFRADLQVDGVAQAPVFFKQATALPLDLEAVVLAWDIGVAAPTGAVTYGFTVSSV